MNKIDFHKLCVRVATMRIKHIRVLLSLIRQNQYNENSFSPKYGITLGEFASAYVLTRQKSSSRIFTQ